MLTRHFAKDYKMSSESSESGKSEADQRRDELANRFSERFSNTKKKTRDTSRWRHTRMLYREMAPAFGLRPSVINGYWAENKDADYEKVFKDSGGAPGIEHIYPYTRQIRKDTFATWIYKGTFTTSEVWTRFKDAIKDSREAVCVFSLAGGQVWVITSEISFRERLKPIIEIPSSIGTSFLMPVSVFVEAYGY